MYAIDTRIRPRDYEESVRDNLKISELYKQVTSSVILEEQEVFNEYKKRNEKVQISYIFVSPETFNDDVSVNDDQIKQYYEENKADFEMPPTINVQYLSLNFPEIEDAEEDSAVETPSAEDQTAALEKEKEAIREKSSALFESLLINPNMQEIAKKNNLSVKTSGFFSMEEPNLSLGWSYDILNKLFQMNENQINEPFETANGLMIVQVKEKRDSYIPELNEAKEKVKDALIKREAKEIARKKTDEYFAAIEEELDKSKLKDFLKTAKALELEIHQTPVFNRGQYLPQIGISKEFQESAFALNEAQTISDVVETSTGYCILHLDNYVPIDQAEYEKAKEDLAKTLSQEKLNAVFGDYVAELRLKAGLIDTLSPSQGLAE